MKSSFFINFALTLFLPLLLIFLSILFIASIKKIIENNKLSKLGLTDIHKLTGKDFEKYLELLFSKSGYKVTRTKYIGDYGADLVIEKNGNRKVIQAKRWKGKVGVRSVQEVLAAKGYYKCQEALVVTNSYFTNQAKVLAKANDVELWDRKKFIATLLTTTLS